MKPGMLPSAFDYWTCWRILDKERQVLLTLESSPEESIRKKDDQAHYDRIIGLDFEYMFDLINESPRYLLDPPLRKELGIWIYRWSFSARMNDTKARAYLDRLHKALKGDLRGKRKELNKLIERDLRIFQLIIRERDKPKRKKTVERIIRDIRESLKPGDIIDVDRIWKIYKVYSQLAERCLPVLKSWETFFAFLNCCKGKLSVPECLIPYREFIFDKTTYSSPRILSL